jgi:glutamate transport system substrate-binding protein
MRVRSLAIGLLVGSLALAACGKEGEPAGSAATEGPSTTQKVAENVTVDGSPTFERMTTNGKVVIGVKEDQPGLGFKDPTTGKYSGFDIEIARLVAAKLGFGEDKIEYKTVQSAGREAAITNGDVDYYVGTYTINDKRKEQISFAGPYFVAGQSLLVRADDDSIKAKEDLKGKKVCSVTGSTPIQKVRELQLTEPENIVEFQAYSQCVEKLATEEVDAVTTDDAILKGFAAQDPDNLKVVGDTFSEEPYGIGLPKDDKALRDAVNDILETAIEDGTWQDIYDSTLGKSGSKSDKPTIDRY